jgi:hypothetical protein
MLSSIQKRMFLVLFILFVFDICMTAYGYFNGNFTELNPIYRILMFDPIVFVISLIVFHAVGFYVILKIVIMLNKINEMKFATTISCFSTGIVFVIMIILVSYSLKLCLK